MLDEDLKKELIRKMTAGGCCYQRIFSYIPLLQREYCNYMVENHIYDSPTVILELIKEWCNTTNLNISSIYDFDKKINDAISEITYFQKVINTMDEDYNNSEFKTIVEYCIMVQNISLKNYLDIVKICKPYLEPLISKLKIRLKNFKKKFEMVLKGKINITTFYENEIVSQKKQLDAILSKLDKLDKNQFPIFIVCYDLRRFANNSIRSYNCL